MFHGGANRGMMCLHVCSYSDNLSMDVFVNASALNALKYISVRGSSPYYTLIGELIGWFLDFLVD